MSRKPAPRSTSRSLVAILAVAALLCSCGGEPRESPPSTTVTPEADGVASIAWGRHGLHVAVSELSANYVAEVDLSSGRLTDLNLLDRAEGCSFVRYGALESVGDGELAVVQNCPKARFFSRIVAVDPVKGTTAPLYPQSWLSVVLQSFTGGIDGEPLISSQGSRICNTLLEFVDEQVRRPDVNPAELVPGQGESLAEIETGPDDCTASGIAEQPALNSSGDLAFASYPEAAGVGGTERFDVLGGVYLKAQGTTSATQLLVDVGEVRLGWSPDGETLAAAGEVDGDDGVFLLDVDSNELTRIADESGIDLAWSPSGEQLAVLAAGDEPRISIFDIVD